MQIQAVGDNDADNDDAAGDDDSVLLPLRMLIKNCDDRGDNYANENDGISAAAAAAD